jgi:hypothetical protein
LLVTLRDVSPACTFLSDNNEEKILPERRLTQRTGHSPSAASDAGPSRELAREEIRPTRAADYEPPVDDTAARLAEADAAVNPDDQAYDGPAAMGAEALLAQELGATMIEEIPHN